MPMKNLELPLQVFFRWLKSLLAHPLFLGNPRGRVVLVRGGQVEGAQVDLGITFEQALQGHPFLHLLPFAGSKNTGSLRYISCVVI